MRAGRANVVSVRGRSGIGKTTLVRRFIDRAVRADSRVVALAGRCYERESVPYKALDALIDSLRKYIRGLPKAELDAVLPRNLQALTRLFPVFQDVAKTDDRRVEDVRDPVESRRRAFAALRDLFARIADRSHVILFIDDLQWGDADSIALLVEILAPPDPPPLLLVLGYRGDDAETSTQLKNLGSIAAGPHVDHADIELKGLPESDARELVQQLLDDAAGEVLGTRVRASSSSASRSRCPGPARNDMRRRAPHRPFRGLPGRKPRGSSWPDEPRCARRRAPRSLARRG
jgi:predicted ATPase